MRSKPNDERNVNALVDAMSKAEKARLSRRNLLTGGILAGSALVAALVARGMPLTEAITYSTPNYDDYLDQGGDPNSPGSGNTRLYSKSSLLYTKNPSAGVSKVLTDAITHGSAQHNTTVRRFNPILLPFMWNKMQFHDGVTQTGTAGRVYLSPFVVPYQMTFSHFYILVQAVAGDAKHCRFGVYPEYTTTRSPEGATIVAGTDTEALMDASAAGTVWKHITLAGNVTLAKGLYWAALEPEDAVFGWWRPAFDLQEIDGTAQLGGCYYDRSGGYGALTTPCPTTTDNWQSRWEGALYIASVDD